MWEGQMMHGYHWMLGMPWGGWLFAALIVLLIIVVVQRTGRPHSG